jgi:hypothetical protein
MKVFEEIINFSKFIDTDAGEFLDTEMQDIDFEIFGRQ